MENCKKCGGVLPNESLSGRAALMCSCSKENMPESWEREFDKEIGHPFLLSENLGSHAPIKIKAFITDLIAQERAKAVSEGKKEACDSVKESLEGGGWILNRDPENSDNEAYVQIDWVQMLAILKEARSRGEITSNESEV